jgi:hypothetical protein
LRVHHFPRVWRRTAGWRWIGAVFEAHEHLDFRAERLFVKSQRIVAVAVKVQVSLDN